MKTRSTRLARSGRLVKTRRKYYLIGIAGIAMGTLAGILKSKGHIVAGSDMGAYPPMSDMLKRLKIRVFTPYNKFNLKQFKPDKIIVGNTVKRGNSELEYVLSNKLPHQSLPEAIRDEVIESNSDDSVETGKLPIVVTGTHGKTTTTAILGWILAQAGLDPTIFCGGFMRNINSTFRLGKGKHVIIEGDEYNTSFEDKNPKFLYYKPHIGIINNVEHDHINIFPTLSSVKKEFSRFARIIPKDGLLVVNADDKHASNVSHETSAKKITFGLKKGNIQARNIKYVSGETRFDVVFHPTSPRSAWLRGTRIKLPGRFNIYNTLAAISVARYLRIPTTKIKKALASFDGVARRSEILGEKNGKIVINDFAHHPTASRETLIGIRAMFPGKHRIIALFEPTTTSSKQKKFIKLYIKSLKHADIVYVYKPPKNISFKPLNVSRETKDLLFHLKQITRSGDIIVMMSSKGFDGLKDKIWKYL